VKLKGSKKKDIGAQGLSKLTKAMLLRSIIQAYVLAIKMASQEVFSWSSIYNVSIFIINSCPKLLYYPKPLYFISGLYYHPGLES